MASKERHARLAKELLGTALNYEGVARGSAVADDVLTLAHCEACKSMTNAALAKDRLAYDRAAEVAIRIGRHFHRKNPLTAGSPPSYVLGGMGIPTVWEYQGRQITVYDPGAGGKRTTLWRAEWVEDDGDPAGPEEYTAIGVDEQAALANARYRIDVTEKERQYPGYKSAETMIAHVLDAMVDYETGVIRRNTVARRIEEFRKQLAVRDPPRAEIRDVLGGVHELPIRTWAMDAFYGLPLPERTKLLDEAIEAYKRGGLAEPKRLPNPRAKRRKTGKKRNTREERRRILRRLIRG